MRSDHLVSMRAMALPSGIPSKKSHAIRVSISFDDWQFNALRNYAAVNGVSFGEAVRTFLDASLAAAPNVNAAHKSKNREA